MTNIQFYHSMAYPYGTQQYGTYEGYRNNLLVVYKGLNMVSMPLYSLDHNGLCAVQI